MTEYPPKKKLRQLSLTDMFMPSTSKGSKKRGVENSQTIETDSDSSQTIESSIECMKLDSATENQYRETKILQDNPQDDCKEYPSDRERKLIENCPKEKMEKSIEKAYQEEEKGQVETSQKRKNDEMCDAKNGKQGGGRKNDDNKEDSRGQGKAAFQKTPKKLAPRKSPRKSPYKEKDGRPRNKDPSDLRNILAGAAERRMKSATPSTSSAPTQTYQLSPDLFEDDSSDNKGSREEEVTWRGCPLSSLTCLSANNLNVPPVSPGPSHTVLVRLPLPSSGPPLPHPSSYSDVWDQHHVRMPCSPKSQYPLSKDSDVIVARWSVISQALQQDMRNVEDFQSAVLQYNTRYANRWKFRGLQYLLEQELEEEESDHFFNHTLPAMAHLALRLPKLVTQPLPLLTQHITHSITLSQLQIASLLANAFFCTFPRRNAKGSETEYASYPDINLNRLFFHKEKRALEKMKCLLSYFRRVTKKEPTGNVTFTRQYIATDDVPQWVSSTSHLPCLHIDTAGLIEEAEGLLQVDFANKFVGGGVLGLGCVQEEIRFVLSPELLVSRLFTQVLEKTEALVITGVEQFNLGSGYASTFRWSGSQQDETPRDPWGRKLCQVTAIDALHFTKQPRIQYKNCYIERELNKAYAGFRLLDRSAGSPVAVATGNWGCGAFKGNPRLKALIQLAVCGHVGRDLAYFTFGDSALRDDLITMYIFLKENNVTVGELVRVLNHHGQREWSDGSDFFQYIYHSLGSYDSDTDIETPAAAEPSTKKSSNGKHSEKEKPHKCQETPRTISEYFKSSSSSSRPDTSGPTSSTAHNKGLVSKQSRTSDVESVPANKEALSDEKISQVLSECDRLVEEQRNKERVHSDGGNKQSVVPSDRIVEKGEEKEILPKDVKERDDQKDKALKSSKEPSKLLSYLDEIDSQAMKT